MTPTSSCLNGNKKAAPCDTSMTTSPCNPHFNTNCCERAFTASRMSKMTATLMEGFERNGDFATPKLAATDLPRCQALSADSAVLFGWPQCVLGLFSLTISLCPERPRPSHKAMPRQVISPTLRAASNWPSPSICRFVAGGLSIAGGRAHYKNQARRWFA